MDKYKRIFQTPSLVLTKYGHPRSNRNTRLMGERMSRANQNLGLYNICFIDYEKAFDSQLGKIFQILKLRQFSYGRVNLIKCLNSNQKSVIQVSGKKSEEVQIRKGIFSKVNG